MSRQSKKNQTIKIEKSKWSGDLITSKELSTRYKISRATVDRWRKEGMPHKKIGQGVRFDRNEVEKWIETVKTIPNSLPFEQDVYNEETQSLDVVETDAVRFLQQPGFNIPKIDPEEQKAFKSVIKNKKKSLEINSLLYVFRKILNQYDIEKDFIEFDFLKNSVTIEPHSISILDEKKNDLLSYEKKFIKTLIRTLEKVDESINSLKEVEETMSKKSFEDRTKKNRDAFWIVVEKGIKDR